MCMTMPYEIRETTEHGTGIIEIGSLRQEISLALLPDVRTGDWVLVYCGAATLKIDVEEASKILHLFDQMREADPVRNPDTNVRKPFEIKPRMEDM